MKFLQNMDPLTMILLTLGFINTANKMTNQNTNNNTNSQPDITPEIGKIYNDKNVSQWVRDSIFKAEGYKSVAYYPTLKEKKAGQYTIGYGTSFCYSKTGQKVNTGYGYNKYANGLNGVFPGATLTLLKTRYYGYPNTYPDGEFAKELVVNHLISVDGSATPLLNDLDIKGAPFFQSVKDAIQEWCYGSGSIHRQSGVLPERQSLLNAMKTNNRLLIAQAYVNLRYKYYLKYTGQWNSARISWMLRCYKCAMHIKGVEISNPYAAISYSGNTSKDLRSIEKVFLRDLGLTISMGN